MKKNLFIGFIFFLLMIENVYALVGFGTYVPYYRSAQTSAEKEKQSVAFNPYVSVHSIIPVGASQSFMPEFGMVFHRKELSYTKNTIFALFHLGYEPVPKTYLRYGLGFFATRISGDGGLTQRNNGGDTSNFGLAGDAEMSYNFTVDFGVENFLGPQISVRAETYIYAIMSSVQRQYSYAVSINYYMQ